MPAVAHAHGNGRGGGWRILSSASAVARLTSARPGNSRSASRNRASAVAYRPSSSAATPADHTGLNRLSPALTSVPRRNPRTSLAGMRKLNPWTAPPVGEREMKVMTPTTVASSVMAGPPLFPCAAGASVWITFWPIASCLKPETSPFVTDASSRALLLRSSWVRTTPGKPRM